MVSALDVPANALIGKLAEKLKAMKLEKPAFVGVVKTGSHAQRPPEQADFWYVRCASLLRQAYVREPVGVQRLRKHYGGKKNRGVRPEHTRPTGGSTIRKALQTLEKQGLLEKTKKGRKLSAKGRKFLDTSAKEALHG